MRSAVTQSTILSLQVQKTQARLYIIFAQIVSIHHTMDELHFVHSVDPTGVQWHRVEDQGQKIPEESVADSVKL